MARKVSLKYTTTSLRYAGGKEDIQGRIYHIAYKCNRVFRIPKNIINEHNCLLSMNLIVFGNHSGNQGRCLVYLLTRSLPYGNSNLPGGC